MWRTAAGTKAVKERIQDGIVGMVLVGRKRCIGRDLPVMNYIRNIMAIRFESQVGKHS